MHTHFQPITEFIPHLLTNFFLVQARFVPQAIIFTKYQRNKHLHEMSAV